jgi:hypothetical protein
MDEDEMDRLIDAYLNLEPVTSTRWRGPASTRYVHEIPESKPVVKMTREREGLEYVKKIKGRVENDVAKVRNFSPKLLQD